MRTPLHTIQAHPWVGILFCVIIAIPIGAIVVASAPPDPGVSELKMSWQQVPAPVLNTGVDKNGVTLEQWTRGTNRVGMTLEAWTIAGNDPKLWVQDPRTAKRPEDWQPVITYTAKAGGTMHVLRYMEFRNKMAEAKIHRRFVCGTGVSGITDYPLESITPPTRTDGAAVKNHSSQVPRHILPEGVTARACEYRASAEFVTRNPLRSAWLYFPPVPVTIVAAGVAPAAK